MDKYKKKSLNFMGYSRDLREIERDDQRCLSRLQRFSMIRPLDDEGITDEKKENDTKVPIIGKTQMVPALPQAGSRVEMLQKWKQEKVLKKQQESKLKKPVFKVGAAKTNPSPSIGKKPLFVLDTSRFLKSSFQVSNSQSFAKKQENFVASNIKTTTKISNFQSSTKKLDATRDNLKTSAKDIKIPTNKSKIVINSKPESKWTKNKEPSIQSFNMKPKVDLSSKVLNKDQLYGNKKQPTITSRPVETKKESQLQPLNARSKVISTVRSVKSNIPSSGLPKFTTSKTNKAPEQIPSSGLLKFTTSKTLNKAPEQTHNPKANASKIPDGNSKDKHIPVKNAVKNIPKFSKIATSQQKSNIVKTTSSSKSKVPNKSNEDFGTFECELSHIEPVIEQRKSFAPKGFMFQPPAELSSSLFLEDGPSAIFLRMRSQFLRTSTPKQSNSDQKSSPKVEDTECLSSKNNECSKNTDKEFDLENKQDFETHLSSSLGSVTLNDKPSLDCKRSLKFDFQETGSTENQEVMPLSSEIIYPKHTEAPLTGATVSNDSGEIVKTEIISADIIPIGSIISPTLPNSVEIAKIEINSSDTNSTSANPPILSDLGENDKIGLIDINFIGSEFVETEKKETDSCDASSTGTINPPVLLDSVEKHKTEISSTGATNAGGTTVTELSSTVDSIFYEGNEIPSENTKENQMVLNGFPKKQANSLIKKTLNFKRSEKPGLLSINESLENTPKSALKKKVLESDFTPRRSLRLAKLSGNFSSLDNLLDGLKPKDQVKTDLKGNFTPRRSSRLSKFTTEFNSAENLFDIKRPTLYGTPKGESISKLHSRVTYDFDRLSSEVEEETNTTTGFGKVSLLPITRPSIIRHSIRGDLMAFSPDA